MGNGENNFGIFFGISYHDRDFGSHGLEGDEIDLEEDPASGNEFAFIDEIEYRQYTVNRKRSGLALNLDYKPSETTKLYARFQLNLFDDTEVRQRMELKIGKGDVVSLDANSGSFTEIQIDRDIKDRTQKQSIYAIVVGGEHEVGNWKFDYQGSYAFADETENDTNNHKWDEEIDFDISYVLSDAGLPSSIVITGTDSGSEADFFDANNYAIEKASILRKNNVTEDKQFAFKLNATYNTQLGGYPGSLKFGFKARLREKFVDNMETVYRWRGDDLFIGGGPGSSVGSFEGPAAIFRIRPYGPTIDTQKVRTFFENNIGPDGFDITDGGALTDSVVGSIDSDYTVNEDVYAGYFMGRVDVNKLRIVAGIRVEATKADQKGFTFNEGLIEDDIDAGGNGSVGISAVSFSKSYSNVLPSINLRYAQTENLIYRASLSKSIVRPVFSDQSPRTEIDDEDVVTGNPELDPYESWNLDANVEYYMPKLGILSAGVFYKKIDNFIAKTITSETSFPGVDPDETARVRRPINGDSADLFGIEFNWQQRLDFLPSPLDGMLIGLNYTFVDSESTYNLPGRAENEKLPLTKQSDNILNFNIGYEKYGLSLRLAAHYSSKYLDSFFDIDGTPFDLYVDDHIQWDLTASYRINKRVKIYFEMINMFDEPFFTYWGERKYVAQHESYDWTTTIGLVWSL